MATHHHSPVVSFGKLDRVSSPVAGQDPLRADLADARQIGPDLACGHLHRGGVSGHIAAGGFGLAGGLFGAQAAKVPNEMLFQALGRL